MNKSIYYIVTIILCSCANVHGQDMEVDTLTTDTTYIETVTDEEGEVFDEVDPAKVQFPSRKADPAVVEKLKNDDDLTYGPKKKEPKTEQNYERRNWTPKPWLRSLLWVLIIVAFIAIIIAFLYRTNAGIFRKRSKNRDVGGDYSELPENIFDIQYESEIAKAVAAGKFHLAVRLQYLRTLRNLTAGGLIDYRQEKTNGDYIFQLFNSPFYKSFFSLTRNYEYVWYGKFPVSAQAYQIIEKGFSEFNGRIAV